MKKDQLIIVLSRNYSTGLGVIRSLGSAGYTVDLIGSAYKKGVLDIAAASRFVRRYTEVVSKADISGHDQPLLDAIMAYAVPAEPKPILFPADDYTAMVTDRNRNELSRWFLMPGVSEQGVYSMTELMDKSIQSRLAGKAGLTVPKEWILPLSGGQEMEIPGDMIYPCFCKPLVSITGQKTEMKACGTEAELRRHLQMLSGKYSSGKVLVQEYLNIEHEIDCSGVCCDTEVWIPALIRKTAIAQYERGVTMSGRMYACGELREEMEAAKRFLKGLHYTGMFDMEFVYANGRYYFSELNLRSGGPNFSYFLSGVNLPKAFTEAVTGETVQVPDLSKEHLGRTFVYEKVIWEDYAHNCLSKAEKDALLSKADMKLLDWKEDPKPGKMFTKKARMIVMRGKAKGILNRLKGGRG